MYKCLIHLSKLHLQPKDITNHFYQNGFDVYTVVVYFSSDKICCCYMIKAENAEEKEKDFHVSFIDLSIRPFRLQCKSLGGKN